jgi:hypothetical protein
MPSSLCRPVDFALFAGGAPRKRTAAEDKEALDLEMDILAAERDGGDVEAVKTEHRARREERKKNELDGDMDDYFKEKTDNPSASDAAAAIEGKKNIGVGATVTDSGAAANVSSVKPAAVGDSAGPVSA